MLTRERDTAAACAQALAELSAALPLDAATLLTRNPLTGDHVQLAGIGYTAALSQSLAGEFVATPWYDTVVRQDLPPSISQDTGRFRQGRFYTERVRPAGFRDGVTGALRHEERLVGLVHLSTVDAHAYDTDARRLLAAVLPALAALADPLPRTDEPLEPQDGAATLVTGAGIVGVPGRDRVRALDDEEFRTLVRAFAESGGRRLRLLWPWDGGWHRVVLHRHRLPGTDAVLVVETPGEPPYRLSPRELEVLTLATLGRTNQAIAEALFLSPRTVHTHVEHVLRKTGTASRAEATALAVRAGLLRPAPDDVPRFVER
ncbi:helix-turn-helix transcriptional regulator [Streptomyces sp. S6]